MEKRRLFLAVAAGILAISPISVAAGEDGTGEWSAAYAGVLQQYVDAIGTDFANVSFEDCQSGVCPINSTVGHYGVSEEDSLHYSVMDVDDNGLPELLIGLGYNEGEIVELISIFTYADNTAIRIFDTGERDTAYLCEDGIIYRYISGGSRTTCQYYVVSEDNRSAELVENYIIDVYQDMATGLWQYRMEDLEGYVEEYSSENLEDIEALRPQWEIYIDMYLHEEVSWNDLTQTGVDLLLEGVDPSSIADAARAAEEAQQAAIAAQEAAEQAAEIPQVETELVLPSINGQGEIEEAAYATSPYAIYPDTDYLHDFEGDGNYVTLCFTGYVVNAETGQLQGVGSDSESDGLLEILVDQETICKLQSDDWAGSFRVCSVRFTNGPEPLFISALARDNSTEYAVIMQKSGDSLVTLADLCALTRKSDDHPDNFLSPWSRVYGVHSVEETTFTAIWYDNLMSTGVIAIPVTYEYADGVITQSSTPFSLDDQKVWTAQTEFAVMDAAGSDTVSFQVSPGDTVHITELTNLSGQLWLKCVNDQGEEGWFPDPEASVSGQAGDGTMGYFQEAVFPE